MTDLKKLVPFLLTVSVYFLVGFYAVFTTAKIDLHLMINRFHSPFWDVFFKYFTNVGDGAFAVLFFPLFIFRTNIRTFIMALLSCIFAGFLAQFAKRAIFPEELRPTAVIKPELLHLVDGVKMATQHSFPSGHSASGFVLMAVLAYVFRDNKFLQVFFGICAMLTAFSRTYLSQHFLIDTLAGALLGLLAFALAYLASYFLKLPDKRIADLFRKNSSVEL